MHRTAVGIYVVNGLIAGKSAGLEVQSQYDMRIRIGGVVIGLNSAAIAARTVAAEFTSCKVRITETSDGAAVAGSGIADESAIINICGPTSWYVNGASCKRIRVLLEQAVVNVQQATRFAINSPAEILREIAIVDDNSILRH